jgi:Histidine phosphatase superfamily (branch 2)
MKLTIGLSLVFVMTSVIQASTSHQQHKDDYLMVLEVSRHGAREPTKNFDFTKDPAKNFNSTENLTQLGRKQHYLLGGHLRQKYHGFLPANYNPKEIHIRSTDRDRTYLSSLY